MSFSSSAIEKDSDGKKLKALQITVPSKNIFQDTNSLFEVAAYLFKYMQDTQIFGLWEFATNFKTHDIRWVSIIQYCVFLYTINSSNMIAKITFVNDIMT